MKLPTIKINLEQMLLLADKQDGVLTYHSDIPQLGYAASTESVLIITKRLGYIGIHEEDIETLISELTYIKEDMQRRQSCRTEKSMSAASAG